MKKLCSCLGKNPSRRPENPPRSSKRGSRGNGPCSSKWVRGAATPVDRDDDYLLTILKKGDLPAVDASHAEDVCIAATNADSAMMARDASPLLSSDREAAVPLLAEEKDDPMNALGDAYNETYVAPAVPTQPNVHTLPGHSYGNGGDDDRVPLLPESGDNKDARKDTKGMGVSAVQMDTGTRPTAAPSSGLFEKTDSPENLAPRGNVTSNVCCERAKEEMAQVLGRETPEKHTWQRSVDYKTAECPQMLSQVYSCTTHGETSELTTAAHVENELRETAQGEGDLCAKSKSDDEIKTASETQCNPALPLEAATNTLLTEQRSRDDSLVSSTNEELKSGAEKKWIDHDRVQEERDNETNGCGGLDRQKQDVPKEVPSTGHVTKLGSVSSETDSDVPGSISRDDDDLGPSATKNRPSSRNSADEKRIKGNHKRSAANDSSKRRYRHRSRGVPYAHERLLSIKDEDELSDRCPTGVDGGTPSALKDPGSVPLAQKQPKRDTSSARRRRRGKITRVIYVAGFGFGGGGGGGPGWCTWFRW